MPNGKLIVIEGTDGSGKKTQTDILTQRLRAEGHKVFTMSFPQYGKKSAGLVEEYLNGKYGTPEEVGPYAASVFYAVDRYDAARSIRAALDRGEIVVLDRYVDSNAGHQGGKIANDLERERFLDWLYGLEYRVLRIPKPDLVVILHVPAEIGQRLVEKKNQRSYIEKGTKDAHERDVRHLQDAEKAYLWLAASHPEDHALIECAPEGEILPPQDIAQKVYEIISPLLQ